MRLRPSAARHTLHPFKPRPRLWNPIFHSKTTNTQHSKHLDTVCFPLPRSDLAPVFSFLFLFLYLQYLSLGLTWSLKIWNMSWKPEWAPTRKIAVTASGNPTYPALSETQTCSLQSIPAEVCVCFECLFSASSSPNYSVHECIYLFC